MIPPRSLRLAQLLFFLCLGVAITGCGGGDDGGDSSGGDAARDEQAVRAVVRRAIDNGDCSVLTESALTTSYPEEETAEGALAACKRDEYEGLTAGEYEVAKVTVEDDRAEVLLRIKDGSERLMLLVNKDGRWLYDDFQDRAAKLRAGPVGTSFYIRDSYELDRTPVEARLRVAVTEVLNPATPEDPSLAEFATKSGHRWVAARVRFVNEGDDSYYQAADIQLITKSGARYTRDGNGSGLFTPPLGDGGGVDLAPGDRTAGFIAFQIPRSAKVKVLRWATPGSGAVAEWTL